MDFIYFVSCTLNNDLFYNVVDFLLENEIFIHIHILRDEESVVKQVLNKSFNK